MGFGLSSQTFLAIIIPQVPNGVGVSPSDELKSSVISESSPFPIQKDSVLERGSIGSARARMPSDERMA